MNSYTANIKNMPKATSEILESFSTRISSLKKELYDKHTNELRAMSGLKRRNVEYDILKQVQEDLANKDVDSSYTDSIHDNKFTSQTLLITSATTTRTIDSERKCVNNDVRPDDDLTLFEDDMGFKNVGFFTQDSIDQPVKSETREVSPAKQSHIQIDLTSPQELPKADARPDIEDLQREAYLAGLKAEGKDESGHPFAKMYRYLWVEK